MKAPQRREGVRFLAERGVSRRRGCALLGIRKSSFYYEGQDMRKDPLKKEIQEIARANKRYGYRRAWALLRRKGKRVNLKRVYRLWKEAGLGLPRRRPRKRLRLGRSVPLQALHPKHVVTYDFMLDETVDGRRLRFLTILDEFTRESPAIAVERRMPASRVIEVLEKAFETWGWPEWLRSDNGPEFIAKKVREWLAARGVKTHYIDPGSPWQNAFGESFNDKVRGEFLNLELFGTVPGAQVTSDLWRRHYNEARPHSSLGYLTPREFRLKWDAQHQARPNGKTDGRKKEATMGGGSAPCAPGVYRFEAHRGGRKVPPCGGPRGAQVALQRSPTLREGRAQSTQSELKVKGRLKHKKEGTGNVSRLRGTGGGF
ncbi:MAG: IS3 family transposase [bacterium]